MIPDFTGHDLHGVWVRSTITDQFGRIGYKYGNKGFWIVWEPIGSMGKRAVPTASFHTAEELNVRPYKPKPWYKIKTELREHTSDVG